MINELFLMNYSLFPIPHSPFPIGSSPGKWECAHKKVFLEKLLAGVVRGFPLSCTSV
jgi:hypothetical protein